MLRWLMAVLAASLLVGLVGARGFQSGTQPGQVLPGPFRAFVVTGAESRTPPEGVLPEERQNLGDANRISKFHDFVTRYGLDPVVAVFAREVPAADQPLGQLLHALDDGVAKNRAARLHAFGVFLTLKGDYFEDEKWAEQIKQIEGLATQAKLTNVPLAFDKSESEQVKVYQIAPQDSVLVLIYANQTVAARFAFTAEKPLDIAAMQAILAEVSKIARARN